MSDHTEEQLALVLPELPFDENFDAMLKNLPDAVMDKADAEAKFKEHLWAWVLIAQNVLAKAKLDTEQKYLLACEIIAQVAHYEGGRCRYLPRGDKLKEELRNIEIARLYIHEGWTIERLDGRFGGPDGVTMSQIYKITGHEVRKHRARKQQQINFKG